VTVFPRRPGIFTERLPDKAEFSIWEGVSPAVWGIETTQLGVFVRFSVNRINTLEKLLVNFRETILKSI